MKRSVAAALLLAVAGLAKLPLEERFTEDLRAKKLLETPVGIDMRESLGQAGFAASLGGLRSLVASITYLQAYSAFEDVDWGKVDSLMTLTTRLQPLEVTYWDEAAWHMAYNAASYYQRTEKRAVMRDRLYRDYVQRGIDILNEGLKFLPGHPKLLAKLGVIYAERQIDPAEAATTFLRAYQSGAGSFYERYAAYQLVKVNTHEADLRAYEILKRYYDLGMRKKGTTIMVDLPILENRLGIPLDRRVKAEEQDRLSKDHRDRAVPDIRPQIPGKAK